MKENYYIIKNNSDGYIKVDHNNYIKEEILKDIKIIQSTFNKNYYEIWLNDSIILTTDKGCLVGRFKTIVNINNF